ncbi:MAG: Rieske 2Fe-2S domain-containing protein [Candidatus Nanopelagicaceae bacterium]|nr:Rieske 2Fe-2S domain-containing protein [Candidatus Nanopelagicaceae bacterium]
MLRSSVRAIRSSWRNQSSGIRLIRLWLGITWMFAGWEKARDPGFLQSTGATYIGRQLAGYATTSPLGFIFRGLIEHATAVGVFVMVAEFAIGLATLFWVAPTLAAFAGFSMSLGLWMAATWHVKPYFLGSDSAYAVLWLAYFLTLVGRRRRVELSLDRRGVMRVGVIGAVAVVATGAVHFFSRSKTVSTIGSKEGSTTDPNRIIKLGKLAVGQTHEFVSLSGNPSILFRTTNGVFAYSEICTHQGCTISYSPADKLLICPCHGSTYDPFDNAKVLSGPAPSPVPKVRVTIEGDWIVQA